MWCDGVPHGEGCEPWAWVEQREVQRRVGVLLGGRGGRGGFWFLQRECSPECPLKQCPRALGSFRSLVLENAAAQIVLSPLPLGAPARRLEPFG